MQRRTRTTVSTTAAVGGLFMAAVLWCATSAAARPVVLSYGPAAGRTWATKLAIAAKPAMFGERALAAVYRQSCTRSGDGRLVVDIHVDRTVNPYYAVPIGPIDATLRLGSDGSGPSVASRLLDDDYQGTFVKDTVFIYPPLPSGPIDVGQGWTWRSTLHMPATEHLGLPSSFQRSLKILGQATLQSVRGTEAVIAVTMRHESEPAARLALQGTLVFDIESGRFVQGRVAGTMEAKKTVLFKDLWVAATATLTFAVVDDAPGGPTALSMDDLHLFGD